MYYKYYILLFIIILRFILSAIVFFEIYKYNCFSTFLRYVSLYLFSFFLVHFFFVKEYRFKKIDIHIFILCQLLMYWEILFEWLKNFFALESWEQCSFSTLWNVRRFRKEHIKVWAFCKYVSRLGIISPYTSTSSLLLHYFLTALKLFFSFFS